MTTQEQINKLAKFTKIAQEQIAKLADFILTEIDDELSQNESVVDTTIRIIQELKLEKEALMLLLREERAR